MIVPLVGALVASLGYLATELYLLDGRLGFPLDDSWIHLQFARQLADGNGLAFNDGELVAGSTAPLWTAILSLVFLLPGSPLVWAKVIGLTAFVATVDATRRLAEVFDVPRSLAALAALLTACTSWMVWGALSAMEIPAFCALSLWGMILHVGERSNPSRPPLSLPLLGLAVLARPEGMLLLALAVTDRVVVWQRDGDRLTLARPPWRALALGLVGAFFLVAPVIGFYWWIGGTPLPTTFSTKAGYSPPGVPSPHYFFVVLGILFQAQAIPTLLGAGGAAALSARTGTSRDRGLLPILWLVVLPFAYAVLSANTSRPLVGNFGRYFFPLLPVVSVLGVVALAELWEGLPARAEVGRWVVPWRGLLVVFVIVPTLWAGFLGAGRYGQSVLNVEDSDVAMAQLLAGSLPPEAVLAVNDIGAIKYLLPNRIVDLAGIATPEVHDWARAAMAEHGDYRPGIHAFVASVRPDYLVVFPNWYGRLLEQEGFRPLVRLEIPDNITMGGDELVLYATPWTRYPLRPPTEP